MPLHENLPHNIFMGTKGFDKYTVDSTIVSDMYITLSHPPHSNTHLFVIYNGSVLDEGPGNDYVLSGSTVTFTPGFELTVADKLLILYHY